ncbi:MAG: hypothetical protein JSR41_07650 [Proteobacteria bacterium]|nr:hypothetical protein [Pseudomonadota bacterium]
MHREVHESARENERTFNGELIHQLRLAYSRDPRPIERQPEGRL